MSKQLTTKEERACHGGTQFVFEHSSQVTGTPMTFALYQPPGANQDTPVVWFLSGLTCTEQNFITKSGFQRVASELGLAVIAPDTSPRGANIEGEDQDYDLGTGAGFYLDATQDPWSKNYRMYSYLTEELPQLIAKEFNLSQEAHGITGHSMGGHGALVLGLKNPDKYRSISAFSPIVAPTQVPWGHKAFSAYLGEDRESWAQYDAVELIRSGHKAKSIYVDQGGADEFLEPQLKPQLLEEVCKEKGIELTLSLREGYDHSYYFIMSFIEDHLRYHKKQLS